MSGKAFTSFLTASIENLYPLRFSKLYIIILMIPLYFGMKFFDQSIYRFFTTLLTSTVWILIVIYFFGLNTQEKNIVKKIILTKKINF